MLCLNRKGESLYLPDDIQIQAARKERYRKGWNDRRELDSAMIEDVLISIYCINGLPTSASSAISINTNVVNLGCVIINPPMFILSNLSVPNVCFSLVSGIIILFTNIKGKMSVS
jgi:hypothetical protein